MELVDPRSLPDRIPHSVFTDCGIAGSILGRQLIIEDRRRSEPTARNVVAVNPLSYRSAPPTMNVPTFTQNAG
jgi:hypothetical protein